VGLELELDLLRKNHEAEIKQLKDQLKEQQQRCKKLEEENALLKKAKANSPPPISKTPKTINDYFGKK
jgi:septal ring factor EnvC (AmiA/AmiB activator)